MQVKATKTGYYGMKRMRAGVEFTIQGEAAFSERWMVRLDGGAEPAPKRGKAKKDESE